ncbi:Hsp70 family protein [Aquincola sp. MAHUQ-54]|uniref:Hsp70 family protein n=1 Tax=Aquincola agrisoli TaxID=3119538 RepID=A0AAW9Q353_9BURK
MKSAGCAIDFGTSNSAIALPGAGLVEVEPGHRTMPTAVFYAVDEAHAAEPERSYGRAAMAAYIDGLDGRLMRSMKSILGSTLADQHTDVGGGKAVRYLDVIGDYLRHLKSLAEAQAGEPLTRAVLGRPVAFVDDDPARDGAAQAALERAARGVGFDEVSFQLEPIAAAFDFERTAEREHLVMVADIGGGTSDFSLVRVGPARRDRVERYDDVLANHGVHIAGTDFDRHLELASILPLLGYRGPGPGGREVPSKVYFDLATWHLINTVYAPGRVAELRRMRDFYADARQHERLMRAVTLRQGHALAAHAEAAKITVAGGAAATIALDDIEAGLQAVLDEATALRALDADLQRIVDASSATARQAGVRPSDVDVLYFTGGSTGLTPLAERIAAEFPQARQVRGDRFASVAQGLGEHARRLWG